MRITDQHISTYLYKIKYSLCKIKKILKSLKNGIGKRFLDG